jgi:hypothetical protein
VNKLKEGRPLTYIENTLVKDNDIESRMATGFYTLGTYLRLMVAPVKLSYYYGYAKITTKGFKNVFVWLSILTIIGLFLLGWLQRKHRPILTLGVVWFTLSILIFSNWFELVAGMVAERLAFSASVGFSLILATLVFWLIPNFNLLKPKGKDWLVFSLIGVLIVMTLHRNYLWKDFETLMAHDIEHLDQSVQAHNLFALGMMNSTQNRNYSQNDLFQMKQKALFHFSRAVELYPEFFNAQFDKGRVLTEMGDFKGAFLEFKKAYEIDSSSILVLEELIKSAFEAKMHTEALNYGMLYIKKEPANELIYELVAYSCLLNHDFNNCQYLAEKGSKLFPQNPNLFRMVNDAKNKVII